jgi:hypothetical protein
MLGIDTHRKVPCGSTVTWRAPGYYYTSRLPEGAVVLTIAEERMVGLHAKAPVKVTMSFSILFARLAFYPVYRCSDNYQPECYNKLEHRTGLDDMVDIESVIQSANVLEPDC